MADQDGRHSDMMILLHVTPSTHGADVIRDIFRPGICPLSVIGIAFILTESRWDGGRRNPSLVVEDQKEASLNRVYVVLCKHVEPTTNTSVSKYAQRRFLGLDSPAVMLDRGAGKLECLDGGPHVRTL